MSFSARPCVFFLCVALLGLSLYLWSAFAAPVVLWSDSRIDIAWAKAGLGIFRPIPAPPPGIAVGHLPKPGYLLFLRFALGVFPSLGETRSIVVVQSALLALSILATSLWLARRRGGAAGLALAVICLLFLRLRDAASAVMTEALAAALLLPIAALLLYPAERGRRWPSAVLGLAAGVLFLIRPNCGAAMLLLACASLFLTREGKRLLLFCCGFAALVLPFWYVGRSNLPGDPLHGLGFQVVEGSADYYWAPSIHPWPVGATPGEAAREQLRVARENWKDTLAAAGPDRRRQLVWRALHGLLGIEYYDLRWSPAYAAAGNASRLLSPFLILAAIAILLVVPWRRDEPTKIAGLLLLVLLVGQNLLLGSNPRYALPFLPVIFLLAICGGAQLAESGGMRGLLLAISFVGLLLFAAWQRQALDWQWGRIERVGVTLRQRIPRGGLPTSAPATLHIRIASPDAGSSTHWTLSASGRAMASSETGDRRKPTITVDIPSWLLAENQRGPVEISLLSTGSYGDTSYLLFPIIPPPFAHTARRDESAELSPATGVRWGALDWWAHERTDVVAASQRN